jgi:biotin carboxylase
LTLFQGNVPVSPALRNPTADPEVIRAFAAEVGYPIMVKAVDGGGGRGIRLINNAESLHAAVTRAVEESPSKQLFAEKAAVDGFRHIEVQIIGDGTGTVTHLWERECSIQRRYQKVVEIAPSMVSDRELIAKIIEDALRMAASVRIQIRPLPIINLFLYYNMHDSYLCANSDRIRLPWYLRVPC